MSKKIKWVVCIPALFIFLSLFISCAAHHTARLDLADEIQYFSAPSSYNLGDILQNQNKFQPLSKNDAKHFLKLQKSDSDYIWLKIDFKLPKELKNKDLAFYISKLESADRLFINNNLVRQYGKFPPIEISAGFQSQYFMFPRDSLNQDEVNTIYIQVWVGGVGNISGEVFIGEQADVFNKAEKENFFNTKVTMIFSGVMFLIFFLYVFLYIVTRRSQENKSYIYYGLVNLYTIHFLFAFFLPEVQWIKPPFISYLWIIKCFFCFGAFVTTYFANSFILSYLHRESSKKQIIIRMSILIISVISAFIMPDYRSLSFHVPIFLTLMAIQFCFSVPVIIKQLIDKNTRKNVFSLLLGFSPVLFALAIDLITRLIFHIDTLPFFTLYGWQITIYVFLGSLLIRFGKMYIHNVELRKQLQEFNKNLEDIVSTRTKELSEANYVLSRGLESVAHVQKNFLPTKEKTFKGWEISIFYQPLDNNVSGDLYDYYVSDASLDGLGLFDVSGHGIPAGLMTILAKGLIAQHFLNGLAQSESMSDVLKQINKSYIKEKVNVENYITGLLFRFSEFNQADVCSVEVANAGHPYPFLYNSTEDTVTEIKYEGPEKQYGIIGIEGLDVSFPPVSFRMKPNDFIVCYTDGLTEAFNTKRESFSKNRVIDIIKENKTLTASQLNEKIKQAFDEFTEGERVTDDITIVVLRRLNSKDYIEEI